MESPADLEPRPDETSDGAPTAPSPDLDIRDRRALLESMVVVDEAPDLYHVYGESGDRYVVDTRMGACTCPDFQYRATECKHIRRARLETGEYDVDALDDRIGDAVEAVDEELARLASRRAELMSLQQALSQFQ